MEKFSIVKTLDKDNLNRKIDEFRCKNNFDPYIFANKDTIDALTGEEDDSFNNCLSVSRRDLVYNILCFDFP